MGRRKIPDVTTISIRLNGSTERALRAEAKVKGWALGTYVRLLLQKYAPGVEKARIDEARINKLSEAARQLSEL